MVFNKDKLFFFRKETWCLIVWANFLLVYLFYLIKFNGSKKTNTHWSNQYFFLKRLPHTCPDMFLDIYVSSKSKELKPHTHFQKLFHTMCYTFISRMCCLMWPTVPVGNATPAKVAHANWNQAETVLFPMFLLIWPLNDHKSEKKKIPLFIYINLNLF